MAYESAQLKPPYVSYITLKNFLSDLHNTVVPEHIDRSIVNGAEAFVLVSSPDDVDAVINAGGECELVEGLEDRNWHICVWK